MVEVPRSRYGCESAACCCKAVCCSVIAALEALSVACAASWPAYAVPAAPTTADTPITAAATMSLSQPLAVITLDLDHAQLFEHSRGILVQFRTVEPPPHAAALRFISHRLEELHREHVGLELIERVAIAIVGMQPEDIHRQCQARAVVQPRCDEPHKIGDYAARLAQHHQQYCTQGLALKVDVVLRIERHLVLIETELAPVRIEVRL